MTRWRRLLQRDRVERQLDAELRDHFERMVADYVQAGMTEPEARRRARLAFGGMEQVKEDCRDVRGTRWLDEIAQDVPTLPLLYDLFGNVYSPSLSGLPVPEPWSLGAIELATVYLKK